VPGEGFEPSRGHPRRPSYAMVPLPRLYSGAAESRKRGNTQSIHLNITVQSGRGSLSLVFYEMLIAYADSRSLEAWLCWPQMKRTTLRRRQIDVILRRGPDKQWQLGYGELFWIKAKYQAWLSDLPK
jgi:hypothetical protein